MGTTQRKEQLRKRKNELELKRYHRKKEQINQRKREQYLLKNPVMKRNNKYRKLKKPEAAKQAPSLGEKLKQYPRMSKEEGSRQF